MKRKYVAIATAAICMAGSVNYTALAASSFTDINEVPWTGAAQYIDEAASLGLMAGYTENGKKLCKAKNNVTYCEAVQLMYSIMCSNDSNQKVSSSVVSKWTPTLQSANIPEWAYDCVAYALENSILSTNDIKIFVTSGNQNNARREDVAVIFGKALSKLYTINSSAALTYTDKGSVSSTSVPYLELLNRLNLMVGDSGNNFNPKSYINRAEMAVLSSKTVNKLKDNSKPTPTPTPTVEQFTGTVNDVTTSGNDTVINVNVAGTDKKFTVTSSATVLKDNVASSASKISTGDTVVIVSSNNITTFVTILYSTNSSSTSNLSGTISSITTKKISINNDSKTTSYSFENKYENIVVKIDGSSSDVDELIKKCKDGDNFTAKVTLGSDEYVTRIDATTDNSQLSGTLSSLTSSKLSLKYNSKTYSYNLPDDTDDITVTINGSSSTYSKLKSNYSSTTYTVKVTLDSDKEVSKIVATSTTSSNTVSGDLSSVSTSSIKVIKSDDTKSTYSIDSDVTVTIDGSSSKLSTLISRVDDDKDYTVKLTISGDSVTKIAATLSDGTTSSDSVKGTLVDLDETDGARIKTSSSSTSSWYSWASSGYEIKLNGSYSNIDKVLDAMDKTVTVTLTLNGAGRVTNLTATSSDSASADNLEGTITSLTSSKISIKLDDGTKKTYYLADSVTVKIDGSTKSLSKLEDEIDDGETYTVKLTLNSDDDVKTIYADAAKSSRTGTLVSVDDETIILKIDSSTYSYDLSTSATVKVDGDDMDLDKFIDKYILYTYEVTITRNSSGTVTKIVATKE